MNNRYLCPKCRSELKIKDHIIFSAETEKGKKGILLISPELGNYTVIHDDKFEYDDGEHIDFYCPVCQAHLGIPQISSDLAEVIMIDEKNDEYKIIFCEIAGKECTIKIKDKLVVESFGEDVNDYQNYWGSGPNY